MIDDIVNSLDLTPEQWTYETVHCPAWYACGVCVWSRQWVTILRHQNGTLLLDHNPSTPWEGWKVVRPSFVKLEWWHFFRERRLIAAIKRYCTWRLRDSLTVLE